MNTVFLHTLFLCLGSYCCDSVCMMTMSMKQFPYGICDFKTVINGNYLYFDKTVAISNIEETGRYVKLWRPRRSGKTLLCNQLSLYYDKLKGDLADKVFENTYIGKNPTHDKSQYLVLFLSFSEVSHLGDVEKNFRNIINQDILSFSQKYRNILKEEIEINEEDHICSMKSLLGVVELADQKLYLIVDEYDSFLNLLLFQVDTMAADLGSGQYQSTVADKESVLISFGNVLKAGTGTVIDRMFFTGITPMAFSNSLSSLNMVEDISAYTSVESLFGYTEEEVKDALKQIFPTPDGQKDIAAHFKIMKDAFDGYRYHPNQQKSLFNPQMCLYYLKNLQKNGHSPEPLLDSNMATSRDSTAEFLTTNYCGLSSSIGPVEWLQTKVGIPYTIDGSLHTFRSKQLFEKNTVAAAHLNLAFHHGFLTFGDPADSRTKGRLVCPNKVYQDILIDAIITANFEAIKRNLGLTETGDGAGDKIIEKIKTALQDKIESYAIDKFIERFMQKFT